MSDSGLRPKQGDSVLKREDDAATPVGGSLLSDRLLACYECGRPFPQPVSEEQARADWGAAADDEIAYCCQGCAGDFDGTSANAR